MVRAEAKCDMNCFSCKFSDCKNNYPLTKQERAWINQALQGAIIHENKRKRKGRKKI